MYEMHRIYCGTPWELEEERRTFTDTVGSFNQTAMARGVLYVPVSLPANVPDKRPVQFTVNENIRTCRHYLQVLDTAPADGWGPPQRHFERDLQLAIECCADPRMPMSSVAVLLKRPTAPPPGLDPLLRTESFGNVDEFQQKLIAILSAWLDARASSSFKKGQAGP